MLLITGDTHGDVRRFKNSLVQDICGEDYPPTHSIILGDFGLIWTNKTVEEIYWLNWLDSKPWETLVVLGNHESYERIYAMPLIEKYGAPMYKISDKVFAFQHGNIYTIEGKTFFVFGGADSIDKAQRTNRVSWWSEELPTQADYYRGIASLQKVDNKVDYILTHTAPREAIDVLQAEDNKGFFCGVDLEKYKDPTVPMLDSFNEILPSSIPWFAGHFHKTATVLGKDTGRTYNFFYKKIGELI